MEFLITLFIQLLTLTPAPAELPPAPVSTPIIAEKSDLWNEGCAAGAADFAVGFKSELDDTEWSVGYKECWK